MRDVFSSRISSIGYFMWLLIAKEEEWGSRKKAVGHYRTPYSYLGSKVRYSYSYLRA